MLAAIRDWNVAFNTVLGMGTMWQCGGCGFIVNGGCDPEAHHCDPRSWIRHQMARLDETFAAFMLTPAGRFEQHYAQRRLRAAKRPD
jgi:hypothetical protein